MDPFSITVSIVSILGVALQTLQVVNAYVSEARDGKDAARAMLLELTNLHSNFSQLNKTLEDSSEADRRFEHTSVLVTSTIACLDKLKNLQQTLQIKLNTEKTYRLSSLKWPLNAKDHRKTIEELRAFSQCIHLALTIDGCALLSQTFAGVREVLRQKQEALELIEQLGDEHLLRERYHVLDWLSTYKHSQKQYHVGKPHVHGTSEWLLSLEEFKCWRDQPDSSTNVLLLYGIQGSGKSVLASFVIDRLTDFFNDQDVVVAYFYFDYREQGRREQNHQSAEGMLGSLLRQLAAAKPGLPLPVIELHEKMMRQQRLPRQEDLEAALLLTCREFNRVFLVIDALDECEKCQRNTVLKGLKRLSECTSISILITSRPHPQDISKAFKGLPRIAIEANRADLTKYVRSRIENSDDPDAFDKNFQDLVVERISQGADPMFLLASIRIQTILNEPTIGEMKEALGMMPCGLDDALQDTVSRIQKQPAGRRRLGINTLMWISHVRRPLSLGELVEALAVRSGDNALKADNQPRPEVIVDCCMGLVTVDEKSSEVRLVHLAVQDYLQNNQTILFPDAETIIAKACITYLLFDVFGEGIGCRADRAEIEDLIDRYPFATYACRHWGYHVQSADNEEAEILALNFLRNPLHRASSYQLVQYVRGRKERYWEPIEASSCKALTLAAFFGLDNLVKELLDIGEATVDETTDMGSTALIKATSAGHEPLTEYLLRLGADLTIQNWYGTALHCTAESGEVACIRLLVAAGIDVDFRDRYGRTSLHCATISGQIGTMEALLDLGADVNAECNSNGCDGGCTPLRYSVICEYSLDIVKTLVDRGARLNTSNRLMVTPLHDAATLDLEETLVYLLEAGADPNARTVNGGTSLHSAASNGNTTVISVLLKYGADINAQSNDGLTAVCAAVEHGEEETVSCLLDSGARTELETLEGLTALDLAIRGGFSSIARMLHDTGARRGTKHHNRKRTPEFISQSEDLIQLLIDNSGFGTEPQEAFEAANVALISPATGGAEIQTMLTQEKRLSGHSKIHCRSPSFNELHCKCHVIGIPNEEDSKHHTNHRQYTSPPL